MRKLLASATLVLLFAVSTAAPVHATDLQVTTDDGTSTRAQGSSLQPAGTGTDAIVDNTAAPDPAVQSFMAGEGDGAAATAEADPVDEDNDTKALFYIGGGIAIFAAIIGVLLAVRYESNAKS